jgi:sugar phosphate isomerase/epimerase
MSDWPIGFSTGSFYHTSIFDVLENIRNGGFTMIEICSVPKHLDYHDLKKVDAAARLIRELGLEPFSFHAPFADHIDITALDSGERNRAVNELLQATEAAAHLGVRHLVIHPGPEEECCPPAEERYIRMANGAASLNRVAERCRDRGLHLALENMLPHLLFGHTSDILYMLGAIDEANVGTCLDTGHAHLSRDLPTVVHKLSGHLTMLHANDNRGDWDAHLPPGHGSIDWPKLIWSLEQRRFQGTIILEIAGDDSGSTDNVLRQARESRIFLHDIYRKINASIV